MRDTIVRGLAAVGWLLVVIVIAFGAAGIVAGMEGPAADPVRSGRTAREDARVLAVLGPIETGLHGIADGIDELGRQARGALAALTGNETDRAQAAVAEGGELVADLALRIEAVRRALDVVPVVAEPSAAYRLSPAVLERSRRASEAIETTSDLEDDWRRLTVGALSASRLSGLLGAHDEAVVEAASYGRDGDYDAALTALERADRAIADARTMRDQLAATVDVTTLDQWLARSEAYDKALRRLYDAVVAANGRTTRAVREALAAEEAAKDRLPPDTRSLVLIMSEIGLGGLNDAAISIEQAHGDLVEALEPPDAVPPP
jgi:hypothetical protein